MKALLAQYISCTLVLVLMSNTLWSQCTVTIETANTSGVCETLPSVTVKNSEEGFFYSLYNADETVFIEEEGTGADIEFFIETEFTASETLTLDVYDFDFILCTTEFIDITITPISDNTLSPTSFTVNSGDPITFNIQNTQSGVSYDVRDADEIVQTTVTGTGGNVPVTLTNQTFDQTYTVRAYLADGISFDCTEGTVLTDQVTVTIEEEVDCTTNINSSNTTGLCEVLPTITVQSSNELLTYELRDASNNQIDFQEGTGGNVSFSIGTPFTSSQTLSVVTLNDGAACNTESVSLTVNPILDVNITQTSYSIASGSGVTFTLENTQSGVSYEVKDQANNTLATQAGTDGNVNISIANITADNSYTTRAFISGAQSASCLQGLTLTDVVNVTIEEETDCSTELSTSNTTGICEVLPSITVVNSNPDLTYQLFDQVENELGLEEGTGNDITFNITTPFLNSEELYLETSEGGVFCNIEFIQITVNPILDANISQTQYTITTGSNITFTIENSQSGVTYEVKDQANTTVSNQAGNGGNLSITVSNITADNSYTTRAFIAGGESASCLQGITLTDVVTVTVEEETECSTQVNATNTTGICEGLPTVTVVNSNPDLTFQLFDQGENELGFEEGTGNDITFDITTPFLNSEELYLETAEGGVVCNVEFIQIMVTPILDANIPQTNFTITEGGSITITISGAQNGVTYEVKNEADATVASESGTGGNLSITISNITADDTYTTRAYLNGAQTAACSQGITLSDVVNVTIDNDPGPIVFTQQPENQEVCVGEEASFTAIASPAPESYQWQVSSNGGSNWQGITGETDATLSFATVLADNNKQYRCVAALGGDEATSNAALLTVATAPIVSIFLPTGTEGCEANGVVIGTGDEPGFSYQWLRNNTTISGATEPTYTATTSGFYQVEVTSDIGCVGKNDSIEITIVTPADFSLSPQGTIFKCDDNDAITLTIDSDFAADISSVTWFRDGIEIPGVLSSTVDFSEEGEYTAVVSAYDNCEIAVTGAATLVNRALSEVGFDKSIPTQYCIGDDLEIPLLSSDAGANYFLFNARNADDVAGPLTGNGGAISFNLVANPELDFFGIRAVAASGNCFKVMDDDLFIQVSEETINTNLSLSGNDTLCGAVNTTIISQEPATSSFQWYKDGAIITNATNRTLEVNEAGEYEVEIDNGFCVKRSETQRMFFFNLEELLVNAVVSGTQAAICQKEPLTVSLAGLPLGVEFYLYDINQQEIIGDRVISTEDNLDFSFLLEKSGSVSVVAEVGPCQELLDILDFTIIPSPTDNLPRLPGESFACSNEVIIPVANTFQSRNYQVFKVLDGTPVTPALTGTGDIALEKGGRLDFKFQAEPGEAIYLKILDNQGEDQCAAFGDTITLQDGGDGGASFLSNFLVAGEGCVGDTFRIFDQSDLTAAPDNIVWDFGDGTTSSEINPAKIFTAVGKYTVKVTATDKTCPSVSLEKELILTICPQALKSNENHLYLEYGEVYPNPSWGVVKLGVGLVEKMDVKLVLRDDFGRQIDLRFLENVSYIEEEWINLPEGSYTIQVATPYFSEIYRVLKF